MKFIRTTYLSLFFLFCFVASFGLGVYQNTNSSISILHNSHTKSLIFSSKEEKSTNNNNLLFEKNENETEDGIQLQAFALPFFISFFQFQIYQSKIVSAQPVADKLTNPIYISVCNFRI